MNLSEYLRYQLDQRGWSLREAAGTIGISHQTLDNLIKSAGQTPSLETLVKISRVFGLPLWKIVEMAGFDLGYEQSISSHAQRVTQILLSMPEYAPVLQHLEQLLPDEIEGVLTFLEVVQRRRSQQE